MLNEMLDFIIDILAGLLAAFLLLRFWIQALKLRAPPSLGQSIFQLTDWIVKPIRKAIPGLGGFDWASLLAALIVTIVATLIKFSFMGNWNVLLILLVSITQLMEWIIYGLMFLLIIEVIFSFVNPNAPLAPFVQSLNRPILRPLRKIIPPIGGFDFSVLVAFIILNLLSRLIVPLMSKLYIYL